MKKDMKDDEKLFYKKALEFYRNGNYKKTKEYLKLALNNNISDDLTQKANLLAKNLSFDFINIYVVIFSVFILSIIYFYFNFLK
jgi:hypothetical protein